MAFGTRMIPPCIIVRLGIETEEVYNGTMCRVRSLRDWNIQVKLKVLARLIMSSWTIS